MNIAKAKKYLDGVAQDKVGKYGLEHTDGTPCDAKTVESCPHNKKAQRADDLSGHEGSSANGGKVSSGNKKGARLDNASDDLHEYEYEAMTEDIGNNIERFAGKNTGLTFGFDGMWGDLQASFESPCFEDYDGVGKTADGKWARITRIYPSSSTGDDLKKDVAAFNEKMAEYGLAMPESIDYDEEEIEGFKDRGNLVESELYAQYKDVNSGRLTVSDPEKFQAYKDSFKEGGSRSSSDLVERVKEDKEWKASPEYQEYVKEQKAKYPNLYRDR